MTDPIEQPRPMSAAPPPPPLFQRHSGPRTNNKAVASLILGICSFFIFGVGIFIGIVAIIIASLALKELRWNAERGRGMAIAGLVLGIVVTALYVLAFLLFVVLMIFAAADGGSTEYFFDNGYITAMP